MSKKKATTKSAAPQLPRMALENPIQPGPYKPFSPGCKIPFDVVQAHRFELVDAQGRIRGGLGFTNDGHPTITLLDDIRFRSSRTLRMRVELRCDEDGPCLLLADAAGTSRITFSVKNDGTAGMLFRDRNGSPRLALGLDPQQRVMFGAYDRKGKDLPAKAIGPNGIMPGRKPAQKAKRLAPAA